MLNIDWTPLEKCGIMKFSVIKKFGSVIMLSLFNYRITDNDRISTSYT